MFQAIHASRNGCLYRVQLQDIADIADMVRDRRTETVTSRAGEVFWFTTHARQLQVNRRATELLLHVTPFTARQVPLLRGDVVITGIDAAGGPDDLPTARLHYLAGIQPTSRDMWVLSRRYTRDLKAQRRAARASHAARVAALTDNP